MLLVSRQGKCRLTKWYSPFPSKEKKKIVREISQMCLARPQKLCNFLEWKDNKIIFKRCVISFCAEVRSKRRSIGPNSGKDESRSFRYASLYFITCVDNSDNELITLEVIHQFVEVLDRYFGNVRPLTRACAHLRILLIWCARALSSRPARLSHIHGLQVCELDLIFNFHKVADDRTKPLALDTRPPLAVCSPRRF